MIRSMTGYGTAEKETAVGRLRAEIRTVNHDSFRASLRLPSVLEEYEIAIREWLREGLPRGHISYSLRLETPEGQENERLTIEVDEVRVEEYLAAFSHLQEKFSLPGTIDLSTIARFNDIFQRVVEEGPEIEAEDLQGVTREAIAATIAMREEEGRRLAEDLEGRLSAMRASLELIEERAPARLLAERDRLRKAIAELADEVETDEDRLAREIAYLAERWDIGEEIVRLRSHIDFFARLSADEDPTPVGKRLRFITQEMLREANTIGAKANDTTIQHEVVAIKNEIERLREQVENIE